jgi:hypothetical protein
MQQYKSQKNIEIERSIVEKNQKFRGEIPFELDENCSGKIISKFLKEFESEPMIMLSTIITNDVDPFMVSTRLSAVTTKDFSVSIQNIGIEKAIGIIKWSIM